MNSISNLQAKYLRPVPKVTSRTKERFKQAFLKDDKEARRMPKMANLVELMMTLNLEEDSNKVRTHDAGVETDPPRTVSAKGGPRQTGKQSGASNSTNSNKASSSRTCMIL